MKNKKQTTSYLSFANHEDGISIPVQTIDWRDGRVSYCGWELEGTGHTPRSALQHLVSQIQEKRSKSWSKSRSK
jgi:hypothetical protein